ncbi:Transposase DDE domain-containing protein [Actinopolyspora lacussalsi subsp. righensis]|uniref:Transposase DDE domain-containing protein n=1 Tax=Actinopolyspora righensis TaxID=995060 RepID=A0A1I7AKK9_9ACTN|nr:transposase [Actinopolyspora righensis]SFT75446.1 Transposase DDE domain-containing protein [Actinopolyspora righensis]
MLLAELNAVGEIDRSWACVDASHIRAKRGAATGSSPVNRGTTGSKHHLICDGGGVPLAITLTGGNRNDMTQLLPVVEVVVADRDYDDELYRDQLRQRGITP